MKSAQTLLSSRVGVDAALKPLQSVAPNLVLAFGSTAFFETPAFALELKQAFPEALLIGCSTAGEISGQGVTDGSCTVTAVNLASTPLKLASTVLASMDDSRQAGERLGHELAGQGLKAVLVFGPGVQINGSALVDGMAGVLGKELPITGGLAGDGGAFAKTWTIGPDGNRSDTIVALGLYGDALVFAHGSFGGWEPFGPARKVTRCEGNVLYELDGEPALQVYKRYLGDYARDLPASGLLFPFAMLGSDHGAAGLIRTILGVSEANGSLTLAGDIDADGYLKLMHASTDRLVGGAEAAAEAARRMQSDGGEGLAILVSCVGRKLVMGDRVDEEVEAVGDVFGSGAKLTGFYSYGEISPFTPGGECHLHNQTMTITYLNEA